MQKLILPVFRAATIAAAATVACDALWRWRPAGISSSMTPDAAVVTACAWLAWLLAGYLALSVIISAVATLAGLMTRACGRPDRAPEGPGRVAALAPRVVRRWVEAAASAGIAATILTTVAVGSAGATTPNVVVTATANALDWPGLSVTPSPAAAPSQAPAATPPQSISTRPHAHVGLVTGGSATPPASGGATGDHAVVVLAGDSLWTIAARHLPAHASDASIRHAWRSWYAANRAEIGPDPDLIRPGQRLLAPHIAPMRQSAVRSTS